MEPGAERTRWPDDRIDDLRDVVQSTSALPAEIGQMRVRLDRAIDDLNALGQKVRRLIEKVEADMDATREANTEEFKKVRREFHQDRRTLVLTVAGILGPVALAVIAASIRVLVS